MDEPTSALDPIAGARIEDLIDNCARITPLYVTHNMRQAAGYRSVPPIPSGRSVEVGPTDLIFHHPQHKLTEDYITGRFG